LGLKKLKGVGGQPCTWEERKEEKNCVSALEQEYGNISQRAICIAGTKGRKGDEKKRLRRGAVLGKGRL